MKTLLITPNSYEKVKVMSKLIKKCKVRGYLGNQGKLFALCSYIGVNDGSTCHAHGNFKCKHMIKTNISKTASEVERW